MQLKVGIFKCTEIYWIVYRVQNKLPTLHVATTWMLEPTTQHILTAGHMSLMRMLHLLPHLLCKDFLTESNYEGNNEDDETRCNTSSY